MPGDEFRGGALSAGVPDVFARISAVQRDFAGDSLQSFPRVFSDSADCRGVGDESDWWQNESVRSARGFHTVFAAGKSNDRFGIFGEARTGNVENRVAGMHRNVARRLAGDEASDAGNSRYLWGHGKNRVSAPASARPDVTVGYDGSAAGGGHPRRSG